MQAAAFGAGADAGVVSVDHHAWVELATSAFGGGLHRSTQHFILNGRDGVYADETKKTLGLQCGGEDGAVGSLATRGA
jgi:hypothetical protein